METTAHLQIADRFFGLRIAGVVTGNLLALFGALTTFSLSLEITVFCFIGGILLGYFSDRAYRNAPNMNWRAWLIFIAGGVLIFGVLIIFGDGRVRNWRPHPAGYFPAWVILFHSFRQIRYMCSQRVCRFI